MVIKKNDEIWATICPVAFEMFLESVDARKSDIRRRTTACPINSSGAIGSGELIITYHLGQTVCHLNFSPCAPLGFLSPTQIEVY